MKLTGRRNKRKDELPEHGEEVHDVVHAGWRGLLAVRVIAVVAARAHGQRLAELFPPRGRADQQGCVCSLHQLVHGVLRRMRDGRVFRLFEINLNVTF